MGFQNYQGRDVAAQLSSAQRQLTVQLVRKELVHQVASPTNQPRLVSSGFGLRNEKIVDMEKSILEKLLTSIGYQTTK